MATAASSGQCYVHADRLGLGVCVDCRRVICAECTTQFEGINRCAQCLAKRHKALDTLPTRADWNGEAIFSALLSAVLIYGAVYFLLGSVR